MTVCASSKMETVLSGTSPSPSLSSFPNEILALILGNFCLHCREIHKVPQAYFQASSAYQHPDEPSWYSLDRQVLHSMCLVSGRFRHVAQPILYHEFALGFGNSSRSNRYSWHRRLAPFLRTVALRPDLAALVQMLHFGGDFMGKTTEAEARSALEAAAHARGIQLSDFLRPFQEEWPSTTRDQYQTSVRELVAMLLACLPNLTCLSLAAGGYFGTIPSSALRAAGLSSLPIQTIDACGAQKRFGHQMKDILEMASSTLRTLNLHSCSDDALRVLASPLPNLRNICLTRVYTADDETGLESLLSRCVGLETFIYETAVCNYVLLGDATKHLIRNKGSLKTLHLDMLHPYQPPSVTKKLRTELMPNLSAFPVLQDLLLNVWLLYPSEDEPLDDHNLLVPLLPPSISLLQLTDNTSTGMIARLAKSLLPLAEAASRGLFPNLKKIKCDTAQHLDDGAMVDIFSSAGVEFEYGTCPLSDETPRQKPALFW